MKTEGGENEKELEQCDLMLKSHMHQNLKESFEIKKRYRDMTYNVVIKKTQEN